MKKLIIIFLAFFIACGPTEAEIQERIDKAVDQKLIEIDSEMAEICFYIVGSENNYGFPKPNITVTDSKGDIVFFTPGPDISAKSFSFNGNLNDFNDNKFNYKIGILAYKIAIPTNEAYIKIALDYGNIVGESDYYFQLGNESIKEILTNGEFWNWKIGLEGNDSAKLVNGVEIDNRRKLIRKSCQELSVEQ
jgi:hypothetical protein